MDIKTRVELVELYFTNGKSYAATLRACKTKHQLRADLFTTTTISRLIDRFMTTGSTHDLPKSCRPSLAEERTPAVSDSLEKLQGQKLLFLITVMNDLFQFQK